MRELIEDTSELGEDTSEVGECIRELEEDSHERLYECLWTGQTINKRAVDFATSRRPGGYYRCRLMKGEWARFLMIPF